MLRFGRLYSGALLLEAGDVFQVTLLSASAWRGVGHSGTHVLGVAAVLGRGGWHLHPGIWCLVFGALDANLP